MADPLNKLAALVPRNKQAPARTTRRRSALAPLPALHPFVSKAAKDRQTFEGFKEKLENGKSLGSQFGGAIAGLFTGAAHFAKSAGTDVVGLGRVPVDIIKGDLDPSKLWNEGNDTSTMHKYFPTVTSIVESGEDTAGRLAQLSPIETRSVGGRPVHTYGDLSRESNIVQGVLGDVLNLTIVAGPAGKALGFGARAAEGAGMATTAARLGKAADVAGVAQRLGGRVMGAPFEAAGGVLKGGRSLWRAAGQKAEGMLYDSLPKEGALARRVVQRTTDAGRLLKGAKAELRTVPARTANWEVAQFAIDSGALDVTKRGGTRPGRNAPSEHEVEVGLTRAVGVSQADRMVSDQIGAEASIAAHVGPINMIKPGHTMTPEGQALGHAYERGELAPDVVARIDKVEAAQRKSAARTTEKAVEGVGQKALDEAQTGDAPLSDAVAYKLQERGVAQADVETMRQMVDDGDATWADLTDLAPELHDILLDPDAYPAPWRESMNVFGRGAKAGAEGLPRTPEEMLAAGMERPAYMSGKATDPNGPKGASKVPISEGFDGYRGVSAEHHKSTLGHGQYALATASEAISRGAHTTEVNRILGGYMRNNRLKAPVDVLSSTVKTKEGPIGPIDWQTLQDEATAWAEGSNLGGMFPAQLEKAANVRRGELVYAELNKRGYDVLNGDRLNPKPGDFNPDDKGVIDFEAINPDTTIVLPSGLKERLITYKVSANANVLLALSQKSNAWFKRNVLPLNAHWTIGDGMSNLITAWRAGEITPVEMFMANGKIKRLLEEHPEVYDEIFNRPEFIKSGLKMQTAEALNPGVLGRPEPHFGFKTIRKAQDAGFRLNEFVNRVQRHEYVYAKLTKVLEDRGLADSIEGVGAGSAKWKDPEVQKAISDVINDANKTLGTFDEMSPLEQRFATQVWPFWSWIRHINTLAARTLVDSPTRMLWTMRLGAMGANLDPDDILPWMRGGIPTPWGTIATNWANPFYDVGSGAVLSPSTALRSTSPLIKFGTTALTGRDLNRNLNMVSHRPGTDPNQLASAFYGLTQASPFTRGALNLAPTADVPLLGTGLGPHRRYGSGQTINTPGTDNPADTQSRIRKGLQMFNVPMPEPSNVVPATGSPFRRRRSGLGRSGLGSGRLKNTGLSG